MFKIRSHRITSTFLIPIFIFATLITQFKLEALVTGGKATIRLGADKTFLKEAVCTPVANNLKSFGRKGKIRTAQLGILLLLTFSLVSDRPFFNDTGIDSQNSHSEEAGNRLDAIYTQAGPHVVTKDMTDWISNHQNVKLELLTSKTSPAVHIMADHGWAYASWMRWKLAERAPPAILIHLDTHDDMAGGSGLWPSPMTPEQAGSIEYDIAAFIIPAVVHNAVGEIYLVHNRQWGEPADGKTGTFKVWVCIVKDIFGVESGIAIQSEHRPTPNIVRAQAVRDSFPTLQNPDTLQVALPQTPILVHRIFTEDLPDFTHDLRPRILDIDEDYFLDMQSMRIKHNVNFLSKPASGVASAVGMLAQRHLRPSVITIALSPGYTPQKAMGVITQTLLDQIQRFRFSALSLGPDEKYLADLVKNENIIVPELQRARTAFKEGIVSYGIVKELTDGIIKKYSNAAYAQQHKQWLKSVFNQPHRYRLDQPSPVILLGQRELNSVAAAYYLQALIYERTNNKEKAIQLRLTIKVKFDQAFYSTEDINSLGRWRGTEMVGIVQRELIRDYAVRAIRKGSEQSFEAFQKLSKTDRQLTDLALRFLAQEVEASETYTKLNEQQKLTFATQEMSLLREIQDQIERDAKEFAKYSSLDLLPSPKTFSQNIRKKLNKIRTFFLIDRLTHKNAELLTLCAA